MGCCECLYVLTRRQAEKDDVALGKVVERVDSGRAVSGGVRGRIFRRAVPDEQGSAAFARDRRSVQVRCNVRAHGSEPDKANRRAVGGDGAGEERREEGEGSGHFVRL